MTGWLFIKNTVLYLVLSALFLVLSACSPLSENLASGTVSEQAAETLEPAPPLETASSFETEESPQAAVYDFDEIQVSVGMEPLLLDAVLTMPKNVNAPPVAVLVQGSGQSDFDETIGAASNKPFRDIARGLAEKGVASLRYNKRYFQYPEAASNEITIEDEVLDDVSFAIELIKTAPQTENSKIIIIGHSLGGMLAPKIALDNPDAAAIVSLAGSPRKLEDIIVDQNQDALDNMSVPPAEKLAAMARVKAEAKRVKNIDPSEPPGQIFGVSSVYWSSLNAINTPRICENLSLPMLFLQGEADFQITPSRDFSVWQSLLEGKPNAKFKLYEGLNHLFMPTLGKNDISEYDAKNAVDKHVIDDIADWIINLGE